MSMTSAYRASSLQASFHKAHCQSLYYTPHIPVSSQGRIPSTSALLAVSFCSRAGDPSLLCWMLARWLVVDRLDRLLASQPFFSSFTFVSSFTFYPSPGPAPFFLAFPFFLPLRSLFFSPLIPAFQTSAYFTKNPSNSSACTTVLILILSFFFSFDLPFVARIRTGRGCGGCRSGKGDEGGRGMSVAPDGRSGGDTGTSHQRISEKEIESEIESIRRFWVRKTEPWAATRRDSKRVVRRVRNWTISSALPPIRWSCRYLVDAEMSRSHVCARQYLVICRLWGKRVSDG